MRCTVVSCKQNSNKSSGKVIHYFRYPSKPEILQCWVDFCGQTRPITKNDRICSLHFRSDDYERNFRFEMGLTENNVPKLKAGTVPSVKGSSVEESSKEGSCPQNEGAELTVIVEDKRICSENNALRMQIHTLEQQVEALRHENKMLQNINSQSLVTIKELSRQVEGANFANKNMEETLGRIFTEGQVRKIKNREKRQNWTQADIAQSITLYFTSARAYKMLRKKEFPLPAVRTLQSWAKRTKVSPGILEPVVKILSATNNMTQIQKLCVLSFDEMKIKEKYCYDQSTDTTLAPAGYVQVAMLRGLIAKWKQPVFYNYDCQMSPAILYQIFDKMAECGYLIVALVSDLGGGNRKVFKELKVTYDQPWFAYKEKQIFVFADVPHMIKLLRNHFIDSGLLINGKVVNKDVILKLLTVTETDDLRITHKISPSDLDVTGAGRQKVKLATKLFSHTIAQAIKRAGSLGFLNDCNWQECFQLFKLTNDWFDVMNVKVPRCDTRERCHAFGLHLELQNGILNEMSGMISKMTVIRKKTLLPFQKGILQSNQALQMLFAEMQRQFKVQYILTYRLNQDVLENFFGVIRSKGGLHDHPDQLEFKYRLRSYIMGRNEGIIGENANVLVDDTPDLEAIAYPLTGTILRAVDEKLEQPLEPVNDEDEYKDLQYDGLENLAGYICHRLKNTNPTLARSSSSENSLTWLTHLSEGGLAKPTDTVMEAMVFCNNIFKNINNDGLQITENFIKKHLQEVKNIKIPIKMKKIFFRARMYFRIRVLNNEIKEKYSSRKRKFNKTVT